MTVLRLAALESSGGVCVAFVLGPGAALDAPRLDCQAVFNAQISTIRAGPGHSHERSSQGQLGQDAEPLIHSFIDVALGASTERHHGVHCHLI